MSATDPATNSMHNPLKALLILNRPSYGDSTAEEIFQEILQHCNFIQPHGILLVLSAAEPTIVLHASANAADLFDRPMKQILGQGIDTLLPASELTKLQQAIPPASNLMARPLRLELDRTHNPSACNATVRRDRNGLILLELQPTESSDNVNFFEFYDLAQLATTRPHQAATLQDLGQQLSKEIRRITGFDRVMIYKFHPDWHGEVIAEAKREDLGAYLGLHYPATDTLCSREMFDATWLRAVPDVEATPVPILSAPIAQDNPDYQPDLRDCLLWGVHPCHVQYLRNMRNVCANLVLCLRQEDKLWGLISCQHYTPKTIPFEMQQACEFLAQSISREISATEGNQDWDYRLSLQALQRQLVESMSASERWVDGLTNCADQLLKLTNATGAVACLQGEILTLGTVPEADGLASLLLWLEQNAQEQLFSTDCLSAIYPKAAITEVASGLIVLPIDLHNYILWFRPEVVQTVTWAGDPHERTNEAGEIERLSPRGSFAAWQETVRGRSLPWKPCELEAAKDLRDAIIKILIRQAEELAKLNEELKRSNADLEKFASIASHDLQEPLNVVSSYVQLLEMRYGEQLDQDAKEFIGFAVDGVTHMQGLIDGLLTYSRLGARGVELLPTEAEAALNRACIHLQGRIDETGAAIERGSLPTVLADGTQFVQLLQNLIGNALKFCKPGEPPKIHISATPKEGMWQFAVQDNGVGIAPEFQERVFVIFQRLHTRDAYPGTGIGLAVCKKIVHHHGGQIWVDSRPGEGATFFFTLPMAEDWSAQDLPDRT